MIIERPEAVVRRERRLNLGFVSLVDRAPIFVALESKISSKRRDRNPIQPDAAKL
jgi:hypothetical protein